MGKKAELLASANVASRLSDADLKCSRLSKEVESLKAVVDQRDLEIVRLRDDGANKSTDERIKSLQAEIQRLSVEVDRRGQVISSKDGEILEVTSRLTRKSTEVIELQESLRRGESFESRCRSLMEEKENAETELLQLRRTHARLRSDYEDACQRISKLEEDGRRLLEEVSRVSVLENKLRNLTLEKEELDEEVKKKSRAVMQKESELESVQYTIGSHESQIARLKEEVARLESQELRNRQVHSDTVNELEQTRAEYMKLQYQYQQLKVQNELHVGELQEKESLVRTVRSLESQLISEKATNDSKSNEIRRMTEELKSTQQQMSTLRLRLQENASITNSGPLRG